MFIYNITVNIDPDVHEDWVKWMKEVHIPDVMNTGHFLEYRFSRILAYEEGGKSYSIQYLCKSMSILENYQDKDAIRLQGEHTRRFEGKFAAFRTVLEVVDHNSVDEA
ncbi:MAG: DUF4286 family protein [Flavobacteriales bacterium]|nr:DUF4286 family protein [Flavobacteriales bacterium]